jgi:hypothetical protein
MPICKNNPERSYTGKEPSPKGLGYCASGEKEGTIMEGKDGNVWCKSGSKWIKKGNKENSENNENIEKELHKKLYNWWRSLSEGNIIIIYKDGSHKLIVSSMKTHKAQAKNIKEMWIEFEKDNNVKAIIWSSMSVDIIQFFIDYLIKKSSKNKMSELLKMKDLPSYLLENYKKYFVKYELYSKKDYTFTRLNV